MLERPLTLNMPNFKYLALSIIILRDIKMKTLTANSIDPGQNAQMCRLAPGSILIAKANHIMGCGVQVNNVVGPSLLWVRSPL